MKSIVKHILLIQVIVLIFSGAFATPIHFHTSLYKNTGGDTGVNLTSKKKTVIVLHGSLMNFNAEYGRNFFDLNWNTVAEGGCDHFDIERSTDGNNYEKVGEVKKFQSISTDENYSFRDNVKPTIARKYDLYYRLKQVDGNGDFSYSKVLIARMYNTKSLAALSVTPDPAMNDILVNVQLKIRSYVVINLRDNEGNMVMKKEFHANDEFNTYKLDGTNQLQPGMYALEIIVNSNERMQMKLLKSANYTD
ncbi:MAG TPA: hypothetical protein VMH01_03375 [Puia sp.]|nr:hypothetical protein [Puia sp.]